MELHALKERCGNCNLFGRVFSVDPFEKMPCLVAYNVDKGIKLLDRKVLYFTNECL